LIDILKNAVVVLIIGYAFFAGRIALKTFFGQIATGNRQVKHIKVTKDSIEADLENAKATLQGAVNEQVKTEGKQDRPVAPQTKGLVAALESTKTALNELSGSSPSVGISQSQAASNPEVWVYLRMEKGGVWSPNFFGLKGPPQKSESITATADVYERDSKPIYSEAISDWKLGSVTGVAHRVQTFRVLDLERIDSDDNRNIWWARIR
jgi:hypothetical protein